jgi:molybdenum cofactor cytidylyltransferase
VVLGCHKTDCRAALSGLPLGIVVNSNWEEGLGTSIAAGMGGIDESSFRAVLLALCDQPFVTASDLRALAGALPGHEMVASDHGGAVGPPAIFSAACFPKLRGLRGPQGAKTLFSECASLATAPCPLASVDVDTETDTTRLL